MLSSSVIAPTTRVGEQYHPSLPRKPAHVRVMAKMEVLVDNLLRSRLFTAPLILGEFASLRSIALLLHDSLG